MVPIWSLTVKNFHPDIAVVVLLYKKKRHCTVVMTDDT